MPVFSLEELARLLRGELFGDGTVRIEGVAEIGAARPGDIAPLTDSRRLAEGQHCAASAFLVRHYVAELAQAQLICTDTRPALARLITLFSPMVVEDDRRGMDPRAAVDSSATVDPNAWIGPFAFVGPQAKIGGGTRVEPFSYIGAGAMVGRDCRIGPAAVLLEGSWVEDRVTLAPGSVIGQAGFGFWKEDGAWQRLPSRGSTRVESDVEIGANTCIDRGTLGATQVSQGTKIDNLVQVGHNVQIAGGALLCAQVGLAGSASIGEECILGGQVGVGDHLTVGAGARVAGGSGVARHVPARSTVSGYPAIDHRRWLRVSALVARLADLVREVRALRCDVHRLMKRDN